MSSSRLSVVAAAALALLASVFVATPVNAASHGLLGTCDLTPVVMTSPAITWPNGCFGKDTWSGPSLFTCNHNQDMRWVNSPRPSNLYTLRTSDVGTDSSVDAKTYTPGGSLTELHLRTLQLDKRISGLLLYATNGTDPVTKKERQVGSWKVVPTVAGGFQVPATCKYTAVTHNGADVKPLHSRFWFSAPPGTGTVRFRILVKQGTQNRGDFWFPAKELVLTEGTVPTPAPQNTPAVYGMVNGVNTLIKPAVIVPVASGAEQRWPILGALGQTCADACTAQRPSAPYCHRSATVGVSSSKALFAAIGTQATCSLPIIAGCPYEGAARVTRSSARSTCTYRSTDFVATCPKWAYTVGGTTASPVVTPASLFVSGTTTTANRTLTAYVQDVCFTKPLNNAQNICICTNIKTAQGANPFNSAAVAAGAIVKRHAKRVVAEEETSAAGRTSGAASGVFVAVLAAMFGVSSSRFGSSKLSLLVLATLALLSLVSSPVSAHNYMRGLHRATEASVTRPCQTRLGNDPHVQIVANQTFELEWTNGHGVNQGNVKTYFAILHASAFDQLKSENIATILKTYLDQAPEDAKRFNKPDAAMWQRQHRRRSNDGAGEAKYWVDAAGLSPTNPAYIKVDPVYDEKSHPNPYNAATSTIIQTQVNPKMFELYGQDRRAVYKNAAYPWLESVDEFINPYNRDGTSPNDFYSHQGDIARFNFTARNGPGDYIAWYYWGGYVDCVDISVMAGTTPVKNRYGLSAAALGGVKQYAVKMDHCEIRNVPSAATMVRVLNRTTHDASQCVNECIALGYNKCAAVQVVRAKNPAGTLPFPENIPWIPYHWNKTGWDLDQPGSRDWPCRCMSVNSCKQRGCRRTSPAQAKAEGWSLGGEENALILANANADRTKYPNLKDDDYVCYGTKPGRDQDNQVEEDFVIADDPSDPVWYSTCYLTLTSGGYLNVPALKKTPISWLLDDRCITCSAHAQATAFSNNQVPFWDQALQSASLDKCGDCSLMARTVSTTSTRAQRISTLSGLDVAFAGYGEEYKPVARDEVPASGSGPVSQDEDGNPIGGQDAANDGGDGSEGGASAAPSSSSSDPKILGLARVPGIIVLVVIAVGGLLLLAGVAFGVRSYVAGQKGTNSDLRMMQQQQADRQSGTEMQSNPASFAQI